MGRAEMDDQKERILELNASEVFLLCGKIPNEGVDFTGNDIMAAPLLLKLFNVFNALIKDDGMEEGTLCISVTEKEAWLLRKYVSPSDADGSGRPIGLMLLRKIHCILLDFNPLITREELDNILPTVPIEEMERIEEERRKHRESAESGPKKEPDNSADKDPGPCSGTGEKS